MNAGVSNDASFPPFLSPLPLSRYLQDDDLVEEGGGGPDEAQDGGQGQGVDHQGTAVTVAPVVAVTIGPVLTT